MQELGAYIQIYKNNGYPEFSLGSFRKYYPESPLYIVSDNGYNFSELANTLKAKYEHSNINVGVRDSGYIKEEMLEWLNRLKRCCEYCQSEYIIYLEDDILIRSKIIINNNHMISGYQGNLIPKIILDYFSKEFSSINISSSRYGACGGTIYNRKMFLNNFIFFEQLIKKYFCYVKENLSNVFGFFDCAMTILYMLAGHTYNINENLVGTIDFPDWKNMKKAIVHIQKKSADDKIQSLIMKEFANE